MTNYRQRCPESGPPSQFAPRDMAGDVSDGLIPIAMLGNVICVLVRRTTFCSGCLVFEFVVSKIQGKVNQNVMYSMPYISYTMGLRGTHC
jgi:hypothetical protein